MKYQDISLTWHGDIISQSGEAQYARAILKCLITNGAYINVQHLPPTDPLADLDSFWHKFLEDNKVTDPGYIKINHCNPTQATNNIMNGPNILLAHWNTINFPVSWGNALSNGKFIELWTSNSNAIAPLKQQGINMNTYVLHYPIEAGFANGSKAEITNIKDSTYVFGYTGTYDNRSNPSDLVIAYCTLFNSSNDVALIIKCNNKGDNPNEKKQIIQLIKNIKSTINKPDYPNIILLQDNFTQNAMDSVIRRIDCYVSTSRGNSINITAAKCIANGASAIGSGVGAFMDYALALNSSSILQTSFSLEPVTQVPNSNPADLWCRTDMYNTIAAMKQVYDNKHLSNKDNIHKIESIFSVDTICENMVIKLRTFFSKKITKVL